MQLKLQLPGKPGWWLFCTFVGMKQSSITREEALGAIQRYCAIQDRCHKEVRNKLYQMGIGRDWVEEIISELIREDFLNEERYARSFARGKFRVKKWGRRKIAQHLRMQEITDYCIERGLDEIDDNEYAETLTALIEAKMRTLAHRPPLDRLSKVSTYCLNKGYEKDLVYTLAKAVLPENEGKYSR